MKLSVIIPMLNEKDTIGEVVARVMAVEVPLEKEIIIVDDGSTDGSTQIVKELGEKNPSVIKVLCMEKSSGKGNAIKAATPLITGDFIIIQDGDMEYDVEDYKKLVVPLIEGSADVVLGSRFKGTIKNMHLLNMTGNRILTFLANFLYNIKITDEATAYKLVRTDLFRGYDMQAPAFDFCPELIAKAARKKHRIVEVPVSYSARTVMQGKKIKWHDLIAAVWMLVKLRF
jgi:dolichol-phosphate mannosyltransferase